MSLRESIKQGYKQVKCDARAFFVGAEPASSAGVEPTRGIVLPATSKDAETRWKHLTALTNILSRSTESLAPVKQVIDAFTECIGIFDMAADGQKEYDELHVLLRWLFKELADHLGYNPPPMTESVKSLCRSILKELDSIMIEQNSPDQGRYLAAGSEQHEILERYNRIADGLKRLLLNVKSPRWMIVGRNRDISPSDYLFSLAKHFTPSLSACYNSSAATALNRRACAPDTRLNVLGRILDWTNGGEGAVYWLNGMTGTGKTTIAYSVCESLDTKHRLAASFFCSRLRGECRNVGLIIPSIAYQLARFSRPFLSALSDAMNKNRDVQTGSLPLQFEDMIAKPLDEVKNTLPAGLVVVIDGLDECDDQYSTSEMLNLLLDKAIGFPIKFVVSSRSEPRVRQSIVNEQAQSRLVVHELDTTEVQVDIETYLRRELQPMEPAPTETQVAMLVKRAGILFIYAATAVRYIGYDNFRRNPITRLWTILDGPQTSGAKHNEVDQLYTLMLEAAFKDQKLHHDEEDNMRQLLYTVICAREPLTVQVLSELLQIGDNSGRVRATVQLLDSVLDVTGDIQLVTTPHALFSDFISHPTRSKAYWCNSKTQHRRLAERCFEHIAQTKPQFNICHLESSYVPDKMVPSIQKQAEDIISSGLLYTCQYWADHVKAADCATSLMKEIRNFLSTRLLFWMEVLNLSNQMETGIQCMKQVIEWCTGFEGQEALSELAHDAKQFVEAFTSSPVSQSTPHIYVSMLAFWPRSSPIAKHYASYTQGPVKAEGTAFDSQQLEHLLMWTFEKSIRAMTVSPDGLYVAVAADVDVLVVDSLSGRVVVGPLKGHTGRVRSVSFSSDGSRIIAGSFTDGDSNATILGWDTRTGDTTLGPFHLIAHTRSISSISFSPDCTRIATGSYDSTIRVWDVETGNLLHCLPIQGWGQGTVFAPDGTRIAAAFLGTLQVWESAVGGAILGPWMTNAYSIGRIAFSPDGSRLIFVGGYRGDTAIYALDIQTGATLLGPMEGHTGDITCIQCSPDGGYIVSGSKDQTIRVWDAQSGKLAFGPLEGHTGGITSLTFTPDGSLIISACGGGRVCTWDAQQYNLASSFTNTPTNRVDYAKFSSDGARFVTASEGTICIRGAHTGKIGIGPIKVHTDIINAVDFMHDRVISVSGPFGGDSEMCVYDTLTDQVVLGPLKVGRRKIDAIACSPSGRQIATGSDAEVAVWDAQDGSQVLGPLTDLRCNILSIQFSPDGTRIVASSEGFWSNIVVWEVSDGRNVFGTLDGHNDPVLLVLYSPDGGLIASGSHDRTIILWDAHTGKKALALLTWHSQRIISISFSPDSTRLVSGSWDETIRIWDVKTGEIVFELLHGHGGSITSVEYSPDGARIMTCSYDLSVRIHDARSPKERAQSRSESEVGDWTIRKDGWVVDDQSRMLVWVPRDLRKALMWSETRVMVAPQGYVRLKFDKSRMGASWAQSYTSHM